MTEWYRKINYLGSIGYIF